MDSGPGALRHSFERVVVFDIVGVAVLLLVAVVSNTVIVVESFVVRWR